VSRHDFTGTGAEIQPLAVSYIPFRYGQKDLGP
jgi:hypothetical protein